jgi:hypothetical protein
MQTETAKDGRDLAERDALSKDHVITKVIQQA